MAITIRELPNQAHFWGTIYSPKPLELPWQGYSTASTILGYEAMSSTDVWAITVTNAIRLRVNRISDDVYAPHVAVSLIDSNNRHITQLVSSQDGLGHEVIVEPGYYKIVAALGMPETVSIDLHVYAPLVEAEMTALATGASPSLGRFNFRRLRGLSYGVARSSAAFGGVTLEGLALGVARSSVVITLTRLQGIADGNSQAFGSPEGTTNGLAIGTATAGLRLRTGLRFIGLASGVNSSTVIGDFSMNGTALGESSSTGKAVIWSRGRLYGIADGVGAGALIRLLLQHAEGTADGVGEAVGAIVVVPPGGTPPYVPPPSPGRQPLPVLPPRP